MRVTAYTIERPLRKMMDVTVAEDTLDSEREQFFNHFGGRALLVIS